MKARRPRQIAPRLANGHSRIQWGGRLPDYVKDGLRKIARSENKSMSWVMEEVVIEFFDLARPKYAKPATVAAPATPARTVGRGAAQDADAVH